MPALIAINVGVHVALVVAAALMDGPETVNRVYQGGQIGGGHLEWYRFVTSAFLHGGWVHLLGNMLFLWVFGPPVEDRFGRLGFLAFYLGGAVVSGLGQALLDASPAIGASGAISGVTGAFIVLFPLTRVRTLMFWGMLGMTMVPSWFFIGLAVAFDLVGHTLGRDNGVATMAHLGGYAYGASVALVLLWTRVLQREPYDLFSMLRHRHRRRVIRAAVQQAGPSRPEKAMRSRRHDPLTDELAQRRAEVSALVASGDLDAACDAYESLTNAYAHRPHAGTLSRDAQLRLVGHLLGGDRRRLAARALEGFLDTYPRDPERHTLAVLLGRVYANDLGDTKRARELLTPVANQDQDPDLRDLAREELGAIPAEGAP